MKCVNCGKPIAEGEGYKVSELGGDGKIFAEFFPNAMLCSGCRNHPHANIALGINHPNSETNSDTIGM